MDRHGTDIDVSTADSMAEAGDVVSDLLALMCIPQRFGFVGIVRTADGFYCGRCEGDIGYDHFIGRPSKPHPGPGREAMLRAWGDMSPERRAAVLRYCAAPPDGVPIPLAREFGVPVSKSAKPVVRARSR